MPPQDTSQLDPNFDYAKLPDGSYAKFAKGTSQDAMKAKLTAKGLLKPAAAAKQPYGSQAAYLKSRQPGAMSGVKEAVKTALPYVTEPAKGVASSLKSMVTYPFDASHRRPGDERMGVFGNVPSMRMLDHTYHDFMDSVDAAAEARHKAAAGGEGVLGQTMASAEKMPIMGPFVERAEKGAVTAGPGLSLKTHYFTPQQLRATAEVATMVKGPELIIDKATGLVDSDALRQRAAKLNTKVLKTADPKVKGYNLSVGLQVAKEGIYATLKNLPQKIEAQRLAKDAKVKSLAQQLDAQGTTVDVSQQLRPVLQRIAQTANTQGLLTPKVVGQLRDLAVRITTERNMQTGATQLRNLDKMTVSQALALEKGLEDLSDFGGNGAHSVIQNAARQIRQVLHDAVGGVSPELQKLRKEQSLLIQARDAAKGNYTKALNDGRTTAQGFIYSNLPAIGVYLGLKTLGMSFGPAIGGIVVMRTLAESVPSRTFRAAMYAKIADALDSHLQRLQAPQGPNNAAGPGSAITGPNPPQVPPQQRLTSRASAGAPPFANGEVTHTNPPNAPTWRGPAAPPRLPTKATRARAGSGDYVTPERMEAAKAGPPSQSSPMADAQAAIKRAAGPNAADAKAAAGKRSGAGQQKGESIRDYVGRAWGTWENVPEDFRKAIEAHEAQTRSVAKSNTKSEANPQVNKVISKGDTYEYTGGQFKKNGKVLDKSTDIADAVDVLEHPAGKMLLEGQSQVSPLNKAMMDRLDTLLERQAKPKSGADRVAIEREITEIKRVLSGEAKGSEVSDINKRIADRERLATKRATAKAESPGASTGAKTGSTADPAASPDASPENRAMLLDLGYKKLAKLAGPEGVKALQKLAKDLKGTDYDEVTALADALKAMQELGYDDSLPK